MSIKMNNAETWIENKIGYNAEITEKSLQVASEGVQAIIRDIRTIKDKDLMEQVDSIIEYLKNAQAAVQRKIALEQTLNIMKYEA